MPGPVRAGRWLPPGGWGGRDRLNGVWRSGAAARPGAGCPSLKPTWTWDPSPSKSLAPGSWPWRVTHCRYEHAGQSFFSDRDPAGSPRPAGM